MLIEEGTEIEESVEYEDDRVRTDVEAPVSIPTDLDLFSDVEAHPYVLSLLLLRKYGPEWLQWELETLDGRVRIDFNSQGIAPTLDKLQAVKTLHLVDLFWESWVVFAPCAQALSGTPPEFRVVQAITVPQLMIAMDTAAKLRADIAYSEEVKTYIKLCHLSDGIVCPLPPVDEFVSISGEDYGIDTQQIRDRWPNVRISGEAPVALTVEDEQLRRMLLVHSLLEEDRSRLNQQLQRIYVGD